MSKTTVTMPDIGEGVAEGEIIEWLKNPGDRVEQDEPVVIVMTDKATVELPSPEPGVISKHYYKPGDKAPVSKPLYEIETSGSLALPKTRALAKSLGVNVEMITPTGRHGEVTEMDVKQVTSCPSLPGDTEAPIIGIKKLMKDRMTLSKKTIPHFSYFEQTDATRLVQLRQNVKQAAANEGINVTYMPFLIRALSLTLTRFPELNSSLNLAKNTLITHAQHNIGIAVSTAHGLIVPVLKNVQNLKIGEIIREFDQLKKRASTNQLTSDDMKGGTITVSNYGVLGGGGRWATPIINHPEVAILAVARIQKQPFVINDTVAVRDTLNLSWSFDHRIIDGQLAAEASHYFAGLVNNPAPLL